MKAYTGGCSCGFIRYQVDSNPQFSFHCQCRKCQRITGTGHSSQMMFPVSAVTVNGELQYFKQKADDGNTTTSGFCPTCGNPLVTKSDGYPDVVFIHAASLDDPALFKPQIVVWHSSAQPWDYLDPQLEKEA